MLHLTEQQDFKLLNLVWIRFWIWIRFRICIRIRIWIRNRDRNFYIVGTAMNLHGSTTLIEASRTTSLYDNTAI